MGWNVYDYLNQQSPQILSALGRFFKSSGLPAYQMSGPGLQQVRQKNSNVLSDPAGREKINKAWGTLKSPGFGYIAGQLPAYQDAQGNLYDAVSGRFMWRTGSKDSSSSSSSAPNLGGGSPSERAYQQDVSRIAQLTAQDPELKRYEEASKKAKTQEEMNAARDIGMAIWARSNPKLAAKVKPGQSGYEVIQNEINAGQMGPVTDLPFDTTKPFSPTPIPPEQQSVTYEGVRPAMLGEVTPIVGGGFPTQQASSFERFRQAITPTAPTFQGSPLGTGSPLVGNLAYTGSVAPLGAAVEDGDFRSEQAQKLAEMFKRAQFQS